jgi:hypothetical protein
VDASPAAVWVGIATVAPWDDNPRLNAGRPVEVVADSIRLLGWGRTLGVWHGRLVWGHTARLAALQLIAAWAAMSDAGRKAALDNDDPNKRWHPDAIRAAEARVVPVRYRDDLTQREAEQLAIVDNRSNELAQWDMPALLDLLGGFGIAEVEAMGFSGDELKKMGDDLLAEAGQLPELADEPAHTQMTFTMSHRQRLIVEQALATAKPLMPTGNDNDNSNGNALAYISELFNGRSEADQSTPDSGA